MRLKVFIAAFVCSLIVLRYETIRHWVVDIWQPQSSPVWETAPDDSSVTAPVPVIVENRAFSTVYQPVLKPAAPRFVLPTAHAAIIVDVDSQETLFSVHADERRQIASLTKLMTALVVVETVKNLDELVTIDEEAVYAEGTRIGCPRSGYCIGERLKIGEQLTVRDLLRASLMNSANDAAIALGKHIGTTQDGFATLMNKRASELGMENTHFCTPSGLEPDGRETECYSTASDIAIMVRQALRHDILWGVMRIEKTVISSADGKYQHEIFNTDKLLGQMHNLIGTKTGFTPLAGYSLLAVAKHPDSEHRIIAIVLDDVSRWQSVQSMFEWSFQSFDWQ